MTREFLSQKGVSFIEKDVLKDPQNLEELARRTGRRATPTVIIGDEVIVGFEKDEIEKALQKAGIA
jgi:glutaredoxin 3